MAWFRKIGSLISLSVLVLVLLQAHPETRADGTKSSDLMLVENGQPKAVIVVTADVLERVETIGLQQAEPQSRVDKLAWAAKDLRDYLEKISGAKLLIVADSASIPGGVRILVGRSALTAPFENKIPQGLTPLREEEGALLLADGQTLVL
ncbi:MAG: hypothetical protein ACKO81_09845, partial [Planctomycetota bacterium]